MVQRSSVLTKVLLSSLPSTSSPRIPWRELYHRILVYPFSVSASLSDTIFPYFLFVLIQVAEYYGLFCNVLFSLNNKSWKLSCVRSETRIIESSQPEVPQRSPQSKFYPSKDPKPKIDQTDQLASWKSRLRQSLFPHQAGHPIQRALTIRKYFHHAELRSNSEKLHNSAICSHKELAGSLFHHAALRT